MIGFLDSSEITYMKHFLDKLPKTSELPNLEIPNSILYTSNSIENSYLTLMHSYLT